MQPDPFPTELLLKPNQVRDLLRLPDNDAFKAFLDEQPHFPRLITVGKYENGKPRLYYRKADVYRFLEVLNG